MLTATPVEQTTGTQAKNRRLGLILASIAATFFLGFIAKVVLLSH